MALSYKRLWKLLIDRDMTRTDLRCKTGVSASALAKGDIMEFVPGKSKGR